MVERLTAIGDDDRTRLVALLIDAVADGASVGFYHPLGEAAAVAFWRGVADAMAAGTRVLLAVRADGRIAGTVQLDLHAKQTAGHRAEVMKLLVHPAARRRGLGAALVAAVEAEAVARGRHLLVLDARTGDPACRLYERLGYVLTGVVPGYAANSHGGLDDCSFYHRVLSPPTGRAGGQADTSSSGVTGSGGTAAGRANR